MPVYQVIHTIPFTQHQKASLAEKITRLHSTEFLTPSLFVNVHFTRAEQPGDFFLAGKPYNNGVTSPNRITGMVRQGGPKRTKEKFDIFAKKIEGAWYEVVNGPKEEGAKAQTNGVLSKEEKRARKLHLVGFVGVLTGIENGVVLPSPDSEGTWLKDNLAYFKEQAEVHDDQPFQDLLKELDQRPDLKALLN